MTLSWVAAGTPASGTASCAVGAPAHQAGDLLVLSVVSAHATATTQVNAPTDWVHRGTVVGGGGAFGVDTGPRRWTVFTKTSDGSQTGPTVSLSTGTGSLIAAVIVAVRKTSVGDYDIAFASGEDTSSGTGFSVTCSSNPGLVADDFCVLGYGIMSDACTLSAESLTATGITMGTVTERLDQAVTDGNDATHGLATGLVSTGTASTAPTVAATLAAAGTGVAGVLRIRESSSVVAAKPAVYVEIARAQGWNLANGGGAAGTDLEYAWTDISAYVENPEGISVARGRRDERSTADSSSCSLTLNNRDGRFTPGLSSGAYNPDIKKGMPVRVSSRWPLPSGNTHDGNLSLNPSVETSLTGPDGEAWHSNSAFGGFDIGTVARVNTRAHDGDWCVQLTAPAGGSTKGVWVGQLVRGFVIGRTYTASCWVYVPTGDVDVALDVIFTATGSTTAVKDAWVRVSVSFVATGNAHFVGVKQPPTVGASDTVFVDEMLIQEGSAVGVYNTNPVPIKHRFQGFIDDWPVVWPNGSTIASTVSITASGFLARLAETSVFKSVVEEEVLSDSPKSFYPLSEEDGATAVGDISGNLLRSLTIQQDGAGGTITFAAVEGPATDTVMAPNFNPISATNGKYLSAGDTRVAFVPNGGVACAIECFFSTSLSQTATMVCLSMQGTSENLFLGMSATQVVAQINTDDGAGTLQTRTLQPATAYNDGAVHHLVAWIEKSTSTTMVLKLMVDGGTPSASTTFTRPSDGTSPLIPGWDRLIVANRERVSGVGGFCFTGMVSNVAVHVNPWLTGPTTMDSARWTDHANAGLNGFNAETVANRLARYARWAGLPTGKVSVSGSTTIGHIDTAGVQPVEAMRAVEKTDGGVLYDRKDGRIGYQSRNDRYANTSAFTLDASQGNLEGDLEFRLDDQFLVNEVTASRDDGVNIRIVDATSQNTYGPYIEDLDLAGATDDQVLAAAQWIVQRYKEPTPRVTRASTNLYGQSAYLVESLLAADVGTRITLSGLPTQAPVSSQDFFIEGIAESFNHEGWILSFDLSPVPTSEVWLLGDSARGQLGQTTNLAY